MGAQETGFDGTTRFSDYLPLADGTRLAYDLILPTVAGRPSEQPLPTLFKYTPYLRAYAIQGEQEKSRVAELYRMPAAQRAALQDLDLFDPRHLSGWLVGLVQQGYAAIVVERPGTGASFGTMDPTLQGTAREADQVLGWIAAQHWCNGRIGMWGNSWQGQTQLAAASTGNPHLKAIMPSATWMDAYGTYYPGGIYNQAFARFFVWSTTILNSSIITPVDTDPDGSLLAQARAERGGATVGQTMTDALWRAFPFRDSEIASGQPMWEFVSAYPLLDQINAAGVAVCLVAGWYDIFARDVFLLYHNLTVPKRLLVRPLDHSQIDATAPDLDYGAEIQRWFDHWLKGVDTGIMDEPAVRYYLLGDNRADRWRAALQWPPGEERRQLTLYPAADRLLVASPAAAAAGSDVYTVDYGTTTGGDARWTAVNWEHAYGDLSANDARALSYTSAPLQASLRAVGHPVVHLWLRTRAPDLDIFAYLEEVDGQGRSTYVTEGALRASHRAAAEPPYDYLELPYHDHCQSHLAAIPRGEPFEVALDLEPTGFEFPSGSRVRVTIAFADAGNFDTPILEPAPGVELLHDTQHPSRVDIPAIGT
jgi:putative CocE/NonD family hydrolase